MVARAELESLLQARKLDVTLTTRAPWRGGEQDDLASTGVALVDAALGGGLARGQLSEIVGARSSGRTTVLCRALAAAAGRGELVALVDTCDRLDPASAAAAGLDLSRLLWIRTAADPARALKAVTLVLQAGGFGLVAFDLADVPASALGGFPFTTWLRLARMVEGTPSVVLVLATDRVARSPGGVTIALEWPGGPRVHWRGSSHRARLLEAVELSPRVIGARRLGRRESQEFRNPGGGQP